MWSRSYSVTVNDIKPEQIWAIWSDVNNRHLWDTDTEWAKIDGPFQVGSKITFRPMGGPIVHMRISECIVNRVFTDCCQFFGATMYGVHEMEETPEGLRLTTTMKVTGPLSFLWRKLVVEKVVAELPEQTDALIKLALGSA